MKLYFYGFMMLIKKFILRKNTGDCICAFVTKMGVVYIKFAQILAMQNIGSFFTEEDRVRLSRICDNIKPIPFKKIKKQIEKEYGCSLEQKFKKVYEEPVGAASISQVHKAILKNGDIVAIKVKRKDVTKKIEKDIKQIRKIVHRFGKFVKFNNYLGSDTALDLILSWIYEEVDFVQEKENILTYSRFAKSVNGKVPHTKKIVVPKVYKKMCTDSVIVMEFIFSKTINQINLTEKNKKRICKSINDYISLSFYALLHNIPVVFHGDPHGGNIYIDKEGNIGFLDMGLIFSFSMEESKLIQKIFLYAYTCNTDELIHLILEESNQKDVKIDELREAIHKCCVDFKKIPVSEFYINMIMTFTKFNISPLPIFYKMAKAMVALYGISTVLDNRLSTEKMLYEQITSYYIHRTLEDVKEISEIGKTMLPKFIRNLRKKGLSQTLVEQVISVRNMNDKIKDSLSHFDEILSFFEN